MAKKYRPTSKYGVGKKNSFLYLLVLLAIIAFIMVLIVFVVGPYMENMIYGDADSASAMIGSCLRL
jgi:hypothetical protein